MGHQTGSDNARRVPLTQKSQGKNQRAEFRSSLRVTSRYGVREIAKTPRPLTRRSERHSPLPRLLRRHISRETSQRTTSVLATGTLINDFRFLRFLERSPPTLAIRSWLFSPVHPCIHRIPPFTHKYFRDFLFSTFPLEQQEAILQHRRPEMMIGTGV